MRGWIFAAGGTFLAAGLLLGLGHSPADGQPPGKGKGKPDKSGELPADPKLLGLYRQFVIDAEALAKDYEAKQDFEKARGVYREILKLIPEYEVAQQKIDAIDQKELTADKVSFKIRADRQWQKTGVFVVAGKPIQIRASGKWTVKMTAELGPDGLDLPKDQREYNLGCLVGAVRGATADEFQPFLIGSSRLFTPSLNGELLMRIYDNKLTDNSGELSVEVEGTFSRDGKPPRKPGEKGVN